MEIQENNIPTDSFIREARAKLWNMGVLEWKLDVTQKMLYKFFNENNKKMSVVNASRRLGKSYFLLTLALEQCLKYPKSIVKYIQPTKDMIRENLNPDFELMLEDCPEEIRPVFKTQGSVWVFPNGSRIQLAGTDGKNYNKIRGGNAHLCLVDEAGFCSDLDHIIKYILIPTTTLTKGKIVLSSTTPPDPSHEFIKQMVAAERNDTLIRKTIWDAVNDNLSEPVPRHTRESTEEIIQSYAAEGGENSQAFRTEFLCEIIYDSTDSVLPEFTKENQLDSIVTWPRPAFFDAYDAMDVGFKDLTVILFGFYDFHNGVLAIEDELIYEGHKVKASIIGPEILEKEKKLWKNTITGEVQKPYKRISDNNLIFLNDLGDYNCYFSATEKHNKDSFVNKMRTWIASGKIKINPRCKTLISHMQHATWNKERTDFKQSADKGHYDAVAALMYLVRNIDENRNPYPKGYRYSQLGGVGETFIRSFAKDEQNPAFEKLAKQFEVKSTLRRKK